MLCFMFSHCVLNGEKPVHKDAILADLKKENVNFLQCEFVDLLGRPYSYLIDSSQAASALEKGFNVDGSSVHGYAQLDESDILIRPDLSTYRVLKNSSGIHRSARVICDVCDERRKPLAQCTRTLLKKACKKAQNLGYEVLFSCELEFFLIKLREREVHARTQQIPRNVRRVDTHGYCSHASNVSTSKITREMIIRLKEMGLKPEKTHHEVAPGQHEITLACAPALQAADNLITAKSIIQKVAQKHGYAASFMPKPFAGHNGSGMHTNYSIRSLEDGANLFFDKEMPYYFSKIGKQFIAGNLALIREMTALFNPTINSYKRLVIGYEAPVYVCWGSKNRSTLLRIPSIGIDSPHHSRAELRSPDATANPYLLFTCIIESGLAGIECDFPCQPAIEDNLFLLKPEEVLTRGIEALPSSLHEALVCFSHCSFLETILGKALMSSFIAEKQKELDDFAQTVTDWERTRYAHY